MTIMIVLLLLCLVITVIVYMGTRDAGITLLTGLCLISIFSVLIPFPLTIYGVKLYCTLTPLQIWGKGNKDQNTTTANSPEPTNVSNNDPITIIEIVDENTNNNNNGSSATFAATPAPDAQTVNTSATDSNCTDGQQATPSAAEDFKQTASVAVVATSPTVNSDRNSKQRKHSRSTSDLYTPRTATVINKIIEDSNSQDFRARVRAFIATLNPINSSFMHYRFTRFAVLANICLVADAVVVLLFAVNYILGWDLFGFYWYMYRTLVTDVIYVNSVAVIMWVAFNEKHLKRVYPHTLQGWLDCCSNWCCCCFFCFAKAKKTKQIHVEV